MPTAMNRSRADIEYTVMMTVLNFQTDFLKSTYRDIRVHLLENLIEVILARRASISAEERLAESPQGRALLQQVYIERFKSGEKKFRNDLEQVLHVTVKTIVTEVDVHSGTSTILISMAEPLYPMS